MKVTQIKIRHVLGLEDFEIEPNKINLISGKNGQGKSSMIRAIQNILGGGSLAEIKNVNTDGKPEIILHLETDESEFIVRKTQNVTTVKKQVGDSQAFEDIKAPQNFLSGLFDSQLSNPMKFLTADDKSRVNLMLKALDLPFDKNKLWELMGLAEEDYIEVSNEVHPLNALAIIRDNIFVKRTGINRDKDQKNAACEQMLREIPADIPLVEGLEEKLIVLQGMRETKVEEKSRYEAKKEADDKGIEAAFEKAENDVLNVVDKHEAVLENEVEKFNEKHASELAIFEAKQKAELAIFEEKQASELAVSQEKQKAELAAFGEDIEGRKAEVRNTANVSMKTHREEKEYNSERAREEFEKGISLVEGLNPDIEEMAADVATLREREKGVAAIEALKKQARTFENDAEDLLERSRVLTNALDALDCYKAEMCSDLPIKGLEIEGKKIFVNGIKWNQLNTAQQIEIAVKVAAIRSKEKELPIVWVDGAEALDSESLGLLRKYLEAENVQAFIGRVADTDLKVEN